MALDTVPSSTGILLSSDDKGSPIPTVFIDMITLDEGISNPNYTGTGQTSPLLVNLKMHIEIPIEASDSDILENVSVCIIRSSDARYSKKIEMTGDVVTGTAVRKIYEGPLKNILKGNGLNIIGAQEESVSETSSGKRIFNVSFQKDEALPNSGIIEHLSYYAFCYLDLASLVESLGIEDVPSLGPTKGPLSGENVISGGKVNITSYVYFITSPFPENLSGTYWTGPVLQDKAGKWRTASASLTAVGGLISTRPPMDLDRIEVRNSKIQDSRFLRQIPNLNFDLIPSNFSPITIKGKDNFDNSIQNPDAYISNAFLTRDMHNNCRFVFEFDYHRALVKESKFGKMLTNPFIPKETKKKIFGYSPITNLRIVRKRVETARSYNRLSSTILGISNSEIAPEELTIAETASDSSKNNVLKKTVLIAPGTGIGNRKNQAVGSIMEILSLKNSPKNTRTIAVTDKSASQLQNGTYQYGVEIEMEDGSIRFLNERLKRLRTLRTYLKEYYELKQIPKKNYQSISSIRDYYDIIFSTTAPRPGFRNKGRGRATRSGRRDRASPPGSRKGALGTGNRNRASFANKIEINNLRTELGFLIGNLDPRETLYPWVIVPEYLVDTIESISDFSYVTKSKNIQDTRVLQTPQAQLDGQNTNETNPSRSVGKSTPQREDESTGKKIKIGGKYQSLTNLGRESNHIEFSLAIDLFDEKAARFSLRSLLDPRTSTSESILQVIGVIDMVTQKVRTMMGSSAQVEELSLSTKQRGVAKNSKVSVLNLKDYFVELFDARLSHLPAVDHIGFIGSGGRVVGEDTGAGTTIIMGGTNGDATAVVNPVVDAGTKAVTAEDWVSNVVEDEEAIDDAVADYDPAAEEPSATDGAEEESAGGNLTDAQKNAIKNKQKQDAKKEAKKEAAKDKKARNQAKRKALYEQNQANEEARSENAGTGEPEPEPEPVDDFFVTPTVFNDKQGTELEVIGGKMKKNPNLTKDNKRAYVKMQNTATVNTADDSVNTGATNQDSIDSMMSKINVEILPNMVPMSVIPSLTTGQNASTPTVSVGSLLGPTDRQSTGSKDSQDNTCIPGTDGGDGATDLARCKNASDGQRITQTLMNMLAENKAFSQAFEKANGNPRKLKGIFKKSSNVRKAQKSASDSSTYGSARDNLIYGMMAKVTIFMGYEKDSSGGIMIKRPIFKSPKNWQEAIRKLKSSKDPNDIILCKLETKTPAGPQFVETNVYFLITKDKNTLVNQNTNDRTAQSTTPRRDRLKNIAIERGIPPEALRSLIISRKRRGE
tara:strand:- start:1540 stop:5382 length:3843 start_codon:yes stop_codon:yes gene_type:complete